MIVSTGDVRGVESFRQILNDKEIWFWRRSGFTEEQKRQKMRFPTAELAALP